MKVFILYLLISLAYFAAAKPKPMKSGEPNPEELGEFFEGDIRFGKGSRNGVISGSYRWPNGEIPYVFHSNFADDKKPVVRRAMDVLENGTNYCVYFVERSNEADYIEFIDSHSSCWSYIGRNGGKQQVSYPQWCINSFGSVQHELLHAIGFLHEQSRSDRDDYVTVNTQNIVEKALNNFNKYSSSVITAYGQPYDYGSVLHYSEYAFSKNGQKTIVPKQAGAVIGQRNGASASDLIKVQKMYGCM